MVQQVILPIYEITSVLTLRIPPIILSIIYMTISTELIDTVVALAMIAIDVRIRIVTELGIILIRRGFIVVVVLDTISSVFVLYSCSLIIRIVRSRE